MTRLLIVDDEPDILEGLKILSEMLGHSVTCRTEWSKDLTQGSYAFDILILDLHLPGFDGFDAFENLASLTFDKPIILISGMDPSVINASLTVAREKKLNAVVGLHKPFGLEELSSAIDSALKSQPVTDVVKKSKPEKSNLLPDIHECLEEDYFSVVYQPQVNPFNGQVVGIECLSRLNHPQLGFIPPPIFIDLLEQNHLISQFTLIMMGKALQELTPLFESGRQLAVSFNVSALSLNDEFKRDLLVTVKSFVIPPRCITLEITETSALNIQSESVSILTDLRIKGFNLSLDDFGTGYSTIRQLNELPFNEIKVDKCFIQDIGIKKSAEAIIAATVELADNINYMLVCEGVEDQQQLEFLLNLNCSVFQGYLFAKPSDFDGLSHLLKESQLIASDNEYWQKYNHISQQIVAENINFRCVNLGDSEQIPFQHITNMLSKDLMVKPEKLNTLNWDETELLLVAGARKVHQIQDIMKAVKGQIMVLYRQMSTDEMVQLFKLGVSEVIDAKTLPQELLYRVYMLTRQCRRIRNLETEFKQLESNINTPSDKEHSKASMHYFNVARHIKEPKHLVKYTLQFLDSLQLDAVIQSTLGEESLNFALSGPLDNQLTLKLFEYLKTKGDVYQQNNRTIFNAEKIHLMILNTPTADEQRLRMRETCEFVLFVLKTQLTELFTQPS